MNTNKLRSIMMGLFIPSLTLSTFVFSSGILTTSSLAEDSRTIPLANTNTQPNTTFLSAQSARPYVGEWSNGRGETLSITPTTIRFAKDRKLNYKDVTRVTDGNFFQIQITSPGKLNYFSRFLSLNVNGKEMNMVGYNSYQNMRDGKNKLLQVTWYR
jgi:hypothetical protein